VPLSSEFVLKHFKVCSTDTSLLISHAERADEQFQMFRRMVVPSSSGSSKVFFHLKLNELTSFETSGITSALAQLRFVSFLTPMLQSKISHQPFYSRFTPKKISFSKPDLPQSLSPELPVHSNNQTVCMFTEGRRPRRIWIGAVDKDAKSMLSART
jgi:hypothetical protein